MTNITATGKPIMLVKPNPNRTLLIVNNKSATDLYLSTDSKNLDTLTTAAYKVGQDVPVVLCYGNNGYKGPVYAMVSAESDVRILEG